MTINKVSLTSVILALVLIVVPRSFAAENQTINFVSLTNKVYGDAASELNAVASSGLPVSFSVLTGPAVITNSMLAITGAGNVIVRAQQAGDAQFNPAPDVDQSFTVAPAQLTVTVNNISKAFGATNPVFTASYNGLVNGDSPESLSGSLAFNTSANADSPVGSYEVTGSGLTSLNYSITYVSGALVITPVHWDALAGGNGHFYQPVLAPAGITWSNAQDIATLRGGYLVTITSNEENDFVYSLVTNNPSYWAPDGPGSDGPWLGAYKLPGASNPTNWAWVTGEPFNYNNWGPFQPNNFGGVQNHIQFWRPDTATGKFWNDVGNFEIQFVRGFIVEYDTFAAKNIQTISFGALSDKYSGDAPFFINATASSSLPVSFSVVSGPAMISSNMVTITGVGTVVIRASQVGDTNYYAAPDIDRSFKVNRSQWTIASGGNDHFYEVVSVPGGITWSNAQDRAFHMGGYLATITSSNENQFAFSVVNQNTNLWAYDSGEALGPWLGGSKLPGPSSPTNWSWVTGEPFVYTNWEVDQPNNFLNMQDHLQFFSITTELAGFWNDLGNSEIGLAKSFIVEYDRDPDLRTNQTITFASIPNKTYGDASFTVSATSSSGLPVKFTALYGPITISGNLVTIKGAGACTVRASELGDTNYFPAVDVDQAFLVNPATLTVVAANKARSYGGTNPVFTGSISGLKNDNITAIYNTTATSNSTVGTYPIVPTLQDWDNKLINYNVNLVNGTLTISPATLTVTVDNAIRAYGATNPPFTGNILGIQNGDNITANYSTIAEINSPAGTYAITATLIDPDGKLPNYSVQTTNGTLTVVAENLLTIVADNSSRTYGATNPVFTGTVNGLNPADNITVTFVSVASTNSPVGTYAIVPQFNDPEANLSKYTQNITQGTLSVTPALLTVMADDVSRGYGATNPVLIGTLSGVQNGESISAIYDTTAKTNSPVGSYAIVPVLLDPATNLVNYVVQMTNGTLTVTPALLTVIANNATRSYGATNPVFEGILTGVQNGDDITVIYNSTATVSSPVGSYTIVPTLVDPGTNLVNYSVQVTNGSLTISAAALTVAANSTARVYGATNPVFLGVLDGVLNGDNITATFDVVATTNSAVGNYPIVPSLADPDNKLGNYSVTSSNGILSISPATLTVVANDATRAFGVTNPVFNGTLTGIQNNDNISVTYTSSADINSASGTYAIVPVLSDPDSKLSNYNVFTTNGVLTIKQVVQPPTIVSLTGAGSGSVVVTWTSASNSVYRVQVSSDLGSNTWTDLTPDVTATGDTASKSHATAEGQYFYRVLLLP